jgi:hypothetical protein
VKDAERLKKKSTRKEVRKDLPRNCWSRQPWFPRNRHVWKGALRCRTPNWRGRRGRDGVPVEETGAEGRAALLSCLAPPREIDKRYKRDEKHRRPMEKTKTRNYWAWARPPAESWSTQQKSEVDQAWYFLSLLRGTYATKLDRLSNLLIRLSTSIFIL